VRGERAEVEAGELLELGDAHLVEPDLEGAQAASSGEGRAMPARRSSCVTTKAFAFSACPRHRR
jgi:hypothetical protein